MKSNKIKVTPVYENKTTCLELEAAAVRMYMYMYYEFYDINDALVYSHYYDHILDWNDINWQ